MRPVHPVTRTTGAIPAFKASAQPPASSGEHIRPHTREVMLMTTNRTFRSI